MRDLELLRNVLRLQDPDGGFAFAPMDRGPAASRILEANDAACALLGYTREELLALSPAQIIEDLDDLAGGEPMLETGAEHLVHTVLTRTGDRIPVEMRAHTLALGPDRANVVMVRDITRRQQRETQSKLDEQRFKILYNLTRIIDQPEVDILNYALTQSVMMTGSLSGYVLVMNEAQTELAMHAWVDCSKDGCQFVSPPPTFGLDEDTPWAEAVRQRRAVITEPSDTGGVVRRHNGSRPVIRQLDLPVIDNGTIRMVAGVIDKPEPYTESDVVQLTLIMEGAWRIIGRKRMETDLILAMRAAENANHAKSQLLANMSHELRTPLNGIMGMTQMLLGTKVTEEQKEYLNLALEASTHLSRAMTSLLDLSSIETGELPLAPRPFNLADIVAAVIDPLTERADQKGLRLTCRLSPELPFLVNGDADKLTQILNNLVNNAVKFTESGVISVDVETTSPPSARQGDAVEVRFTVADSGIGIPAEKQEAIFESFTLAEDYLTKRYGGLGLGLSISRKLAGLMGGSITLESFPGKGSTFVLTLPFQVREVGPDRCAPPKEDGRNVLGLNILVAEDEQVNALVTSRILKKSGHHPTVVGNGQHAIDALMSRLYDMVLMDVQMPVINGLQVTEIIRSGAAEGIDSQIPIIGLTAFAGDTDRQRFLAAGMDDVITKPFEASDLLEAIVRATTRSA